MFGGDAILKLELSEVDNLMSGLQGMVATAVPLGHSRYAGTLSTLDLGDIALQVVRSAPMLVLGSSSEGRAGLVQVLEGSGQARWNGQPIEANEISVYAAGGQHEAVYPEDFACTFLSFPRARAEGALTLPASSRLPRVGPRSGARAEPDARAALAAIARAFEQAAADTSSALLGTDARRALRAEVLDITRSLLEPADVNLGRRARDDRTRRRIVRAADDYLRANPARPVYTEDLCVALGTSATRLHQAFSATFGISPHRYLKMRRMSMARAALLSRSGPWRSVKAAALSHGFWHLGQFARDYRALYGEAPSNTLARVPERAGDTGADVKDDCQGST
jgi:AraC family transcriptional regulator, ethanolamine operon transcriptional activator